MIQPITLQLRLPEDVPFHADLAYVLYGALCEVIPPDLAEAFHTQDITPLRQHLRRGTEPNTCIWVFDLFDGALELTDFLRNWKQIELHCCTTPLQVLQCSMSEPLTISSLLQQSQTWPDRPTSFTFETPCSFKSGGQYMLFPSIELIVQSLFLRWNTLMPECSMEDADALQMLIHGLQIRSYRLSSRMYRLKGQRIPGFSGNIHISAHLPAPMQELWKLLLTFAPHSGLGIKTALGMGGVTVAPIKPRKSIEPLFVD